MPTAVSALNANQETIQAGIWSVSKHIQSFTDELKLSKEIFAGNTITFGGYYAHVKDHDVWNLGNSILLALEPQARVLNASLADGTQLTRDGFTSANSYDVNAYLQERQRRRLRQRRMEDRQAAARRRRPRRARETA